MIKKILSYLRTTWLIIGSFIIFVVAIEICASILIFAKHPHDYRADSDGFAKVEWAKEYFKEFIHSGYTEWHPYIYWRRRPFNGNFINIDKDGLRYTWNGKDEATAKKISVFMYGGSTLWGTGSRDNYTIPSYVSRILHDQYGINLEVTNYGESGYVSTQEVIGLIRELQVGHIPDVVIFYDGVNDTYSAIQNRKAGLSQNEINRENEFNILNAGYEGELFKHGIISLLKNSSMYRVVDYVGKKIIGHDHYTFQFSEMSQDEIDKIADDAIRIYRANQTVVTQLAKAYKFRVLYYWQPVIYMKNSLTDYEEKQYREAYTDESFFKNVYGRIKKYANGSSQLHDVSDLFANTTGGYYIDFCHLNEEGNEIVARRMIGDLVKVIKE